jgi:hypothetical protein
MMISQNDDRYPIAVIFIELDDLLLENYWRKYRTYEQLGWDQKSIEEFLAKKENKLKIASFNTGTTNFTGPTREDRYNEIYNHSNLINQDVAVLGAVEMMHALQEGVYCHVLSSRPTTQQTDVKNHLKYLGFPTDNMDIYFRAPTESVMAFRNKTLKLIQKKFILGFGVCLSSEDSIGFDRLKYPTIGFASIKEVDVLKLSFEKVYSSWEEIAGYVMEMIRTLPKRKFDQALGQLVAASTQKVTSTVDVSALTAKFETLLDFPITEAETPSVFNRAEARSETQNLLDQAVYQQLFSGQGSEKILGSDDSHSIQIENVEYLLNSYMAELKTQLPMIEQGKVPEFFAALTERYQLDLSDVQVQVEANLAAIMNVDNQENVRVFITVTKLIEKLRNMSFEHFAIGWIGWLFYETTRQPFEGPIRQKFDTLLQNNDPDISLLYNVSFILWLTHLYPDTPYSEPIKNVIQAHTKKVIGKLF